MFVVWLLSGKQLSGAGIVEFVWHLFQVRICLSNRVRSTISNSTTDILSYDGHDDICATCI